MVENVPQDLKPEVAAPKEAVIIDDRPVFRIGQSPFATGLKKYEPGEMIVWAVPEGWDEKKWGRHFASYGPSTSFIPLNKPAEKLLADHHAELKRRREKSASVEGGANAATQAMMLEIMGKVLEQQAENRRVQEKLAEALEALAAQAKKK